MCTWLKIQFPHFTKNCYSRVRIFTCCLACDNVFSSKNWIASKHLGKQPTDQLHLKRWWWYSETGGESQFIPSFELLPDRTNRWVAQINTAESSHTFWGLRTFQSWIWTERWDEPGVGVNNKVATVTFRFVTCLPLGSLPLSIFSLKPLRKCYLDLKCLISLDKRFSEKYSVFTVLWT